MRTALYRHYDADGQLLYVGISKDIESPIEPVVVGLEVAAAMYGISADEITELQRTSGFPFVRIGRRRLVPVAEATAWFQAQVRHEWAA